LYLGNPLPQKIDVRRFLGRGGCQEQYGNSSVMKIVDESVPIPQANEVLVKIKSVAINPLDWKIRNGELKLMTGKQFPKNMGCEFSGIVEKIGSEVKENLLGKRVFGFVENPMKQGVSREYICTPIHCIVEIPSQISFEEASAVTICGVAALQSIKTIANAKAGQTILINGCTGGIGLFAIQIAKKMGLKVFGVCSTEFVNLAKEFDCDEVIDYKKINILNFQHQFDIILELSGKMLFSKSQLLMNNNSVFIDPIVTPQAIFKSFFINLFRSKKYKVLLTKYNNPILNEIVMLVNDGLKIKINKVYSFNNAIAAYAETEKKGSVGKTIINIDIT
jgi:NADPH:quinone reductase-like Zn-dependent oxidoreductase